MGEKLTMSAWVYPKDNGWSNIAMRGSYGYGFALSGNATCGSSNRLVYWDQSSCGNSIYSTLTYTLNNWQHVAVTVEDIGTQLRIYFYLNGVKDGPYYSNISAINNGGTSKPLYIAEQGECFCNYFGGNLDELRIWSVVRTQAEIQATMNKRLNGSESGLVAYYKMNEGSGTSLADSSSNSNTGTLISMANEDWVDGNANFNDRSHLFNISNISGHTSEDGSNATFNVKLSSSPSVFASNYVTATLSSSDTGEGTVSPSSLTFTSNNWDSVQTVTATGVNDTNLDGNQAYNINLTGGHSPHRYWRARNLTPKEAWNVKEIQFLSDTTLYNANQNTIAQPESSPLHDGSNCIQSGQYGSHGCDRSFDNNLDSWWSSWASGNQAETWIGMDFGNSPIDVVHVRFMIGRPPGADQTVVIEWSDDASNWTAWTGGTISTRSKVQDQVAGSRTNTWDEVAIQDSFSLALHNLDDDTDVTVNLASSDTGEAPVTPATLTFTEDNWDTAQTVTVTGVNDTDRDRNKSYRIRLTSEDQKTDSPEVSTFAGSPAGSSSSGSTNATGTSARFKEPYGIASDGTNLYVTDFRNHMIRKIVIATGVVTTFAGSTTSGSADGTGASARFKTPDHKTTDGTNLYVVDQQNNTIRKIVIATGAVTTLAGSAGSQGSTNGTGSTARFKYPDHVTTDGTNL